MAYDPVKAHEYYMQYRKQGKKKGRKKGKGKTTSAKKTSLIGLSTAGLNDNGKMQWALKKKTLQDELNEKLAKTTDPNERKELVEDYQSKALNELRKIKSDPNMATAKSPILRIACNNTPPSFVSASAAPDSTRSDTTSPNVFM